MRTTCSMRWLQRRRRVVEQQVGFVEHEHQFRLVEVADFRQVLEQLRQQPQQELEYRRGFRISWFGGEDVDDAAAVQVGAHQVAQLQRRLAEEGITAFLLQAQQRALDRADRLAC
jgi:hypothetical protein